MSSTYLALKSMPSSCAVPRLRERVSRVTRTGETTPPDEIRAWLVDVGLRTVKLKFAGLN